MYGPKDVPGSFGKVGAASPHPISTWLDAHCTRCARRLLFCWLATLQYGKILDNLWPQSNVQAFGSDHVGNIDNEDFLEKQISLAVTVYSRHGSS